MPRAYSARRGRIGCAVLPALKSMLRLPFWMFTFLATSWLPVSVALLPSSVNVAFGR